MKALKIAALSILSLVVLVIAGLVIAMMVIDPNDHKKLAEEAVQKQTGLTLRLGEVGWQFFPAIGLSVSELSLIDETLPASTQSLVSANKASVALALMPLLKQQVRVQEVTLHTPVIQYVTTKDGASNWDRLTQASGETEPSPKPEASSEAELPDFHVAAFEISDASLKLRDEKTGSNTQIDNLNLRLTDVALGQAIPLTFSVGVQQDATLDVKVRGQGQLSVASDLKTFTLSPFELTATIAKAPGLNGAQIVNLSLNADADLNKDTASVKNLTLSLAELTVNADATINALTQTPTLNGTVKIKPFSPKKWVPKVLGTPLPPTAKGDSLSAMSLESTLSGPLTGEAPVISIKPLKLALDDTTVTGYATVNLATQSIDSNLSLDKMNLDDYLPPTADEPVAEAKPEPQPDDAAGSAELIPVEALRPLKAQLQFNAKKLTFKEMPIEQLTLNARANEGLIELQSFNAKLLGGNISTKGSLDVRSNTPKMKLDHATQTLRLHPVIQAFLGKDLADGAISLTANVATQGNTVDKLIQSLVGNSEMKIQDGTLKGINLTEMAYKKLNEWGPLVSSLVPEDYAQRVPPAFQKNTDIKNMLAKMEFKDGKIHTKDLGATVKGSNIQGAGEVDMSTLAGTMRLNLKLSESLTNPTLAELSWPVVCSFSASALPSCDLKSGPVREELEKMAKRALEDKAKTALNKKLSEKLKLDENQDVEAAAKAKLKAEEDAAKEKLRAEQEAAKAKLRAEEERAKERAAEKVQDAFKKLF